MNLTQTKNNGELSSSGVKSLFDILTINKDLFTGAMYKTL